MTQFQPLRFLGGMASVALISLAPTFATAQVASDSLRREFLLPQPATFNVAARGSWISPGIAIGVPTGFGADYGDAFAAVGFQASTRAVDRPDAGVVVGFGIGNAVDLVGLEIAVSGFGTFRSCCRGGISPKLHRVLPSTSSIAFGVENLVTWGNMEDEDIATDSGRSVYLVGTKAFLFRPDPGSFFGSGALTLGVGNGRFRRESDILDDDETINPFGSASLRIIEQASVIGSWTGQDLVAGLSIVPIPNVPLFITPGVADLTTDPRFIVGIGYGIDYSGLF
jgi:hypothetical protein